MTATAKVLVTTAPVENQVHSNADLNTEAFQNAAMGILPNEKQIQAMAASLNIDQKELTKAIAAFRGQFQANPHADSAEMSKQMRAIQTRLSNLAGKIEILELVGDVVAKLTAIDTAEDPQGRTLILEEALRPLYSSKSLDGTKYSAKDIKAARYLRAYFGLQKALSEHGTIKDSFEIRADSIKNLGESVGTSLHTRRTQAYALSIVAVDAANALSHKESIHSSSLERVVRASVQIQQADPRETSSTILLSNEKLPSLGAIQASSIVKTPSTVFFNDLALQILAIQEAISNRRVMEVDSRQYLPGYAGLITAPAYKRTGTESLN